MKHATGQLTPEAIAEMKQQIAMKAMLEGINFAFFVTVFIAGLALVLAFFIKRAKQAEDIEAKSSEKKIVNKLVEN